VQGKHAQFGATRQHDDKSTRGAQAATGRHKAGRRDIRLEEIQ
jgi:hypothetical protein